MCPITAEYMKNEYFDAKANVPVRVNGVLEKELKEKAGDASSNSALKFLYSFPYCTYNIQ